MSILEKARRALEMAPVAVSAFEFVNDIRTGKFASLSGKSAAEILEIVFTIAEKVIAGFMGTSPVGDVKDEISKMRSGFETNDEHARRRVDEEFE